MKKFLTLKNILLCSACIFALVAFILSFTADVKFVDAEGYGEMFFNFIWGPKKLAEFGNGQTQTAPIPAELLPMPVATLPLVGSLLVFIGAVAAVVVGLLVKKPWAKWVVLGCAVVVLVGGVFFFFIKDGALAQLAKAMRVDKEGAQAIIDYYKLKIKSAGAVVGGIMGILSACSLCGAAFVPEKQLLK